MLHYQGAYKLYIPRQFTEIFVYKTWIIENEIEKQPGLTLKDKRSVFILKNRMCREELGKFSQETLKVSSTMRGKNIQELFDQPW